MMLEFLTRPSFGRTSHTKSKTVVCSSLSMMSSGLRRQRASSPQALLHGLPEYEAVDLEVEGTQRVVEGENVLRVVKRLGDGDALPRHREMFTRWATSYMSPSRRVFGSHFRNHSPHESPELERLDEADVLEIRHIHQTLILNRERDLPMNPAYPLHTLELA